jgi:hypothetical protein
MSSSDMTSPGCSIASDIFVTVSGRQDACV